MMGWSSLRNDMTKETHWCVRCKEMMVHVQKKTATPLLMATNPDSSVALMCLSGSIWRHPHKHLLTTFQQLTTHLRMLAAMKITIDFSSCAGNDWDWLWWHCLFWWLRSCHYTLMSKERASEIRAEAKPPKISSVHKYIVVLLVYTTHFRSIYFFDAWDTIFYTYKLRRN